MFPISISTKIIIPQTDRKITSERYLLNQIEDQLAYLDMYMTRLGDDELFLKKDDFIRTMRKKDFLKNLSVQVSTDDSAIQIKLTTETILIFIFGLIPFGSLLFENLDFNIYFLIFPTLFIWGFGYFSKYLILHDIKNEIQQHLKKINGL